MERVIKYNEDNSCIEIYVNKYAKKPKINIYTTYIEEEIVSPYARSCLQKLLNTNPIEYANIVLNDELEYYVELCIQEQKALKGCVYND